MKTKSMTIWMMVVVLCLTSPKAIGWLQFKDGGTHNIDYEINDDVWVDFQAPGMQTTVNWLDGGAIGSPYNLQVFEDSQLNILGGFINSTLYARDRSQVDFSDGLIYKLNAYDSSQVSMSGGTSSINAYANSQVDISGGLIQYLYPYVNSQVTISGGSVGYLWAYGSSQVDISGGSVGRDLMASNDAILTIHGSDFAVDSVPFGYGELTSILGNDYGYEPYRRLTGTLLSGDPINNQFRIGNDGKIVLVPEPASAVILGLGGFFLVLRRRRRQD